MFMLSILRSSCRELYAKFCTSTYVLYAPKSTYYFSFYCVSYELVFDDLKKV